MQRTHIYLPEELNREIDYIARLEGKTKAEVTRRILEEGLKVIQPQKSGSAKALLDIAKEAEKLNVSGPRDLSFNHDYYTWGGKKKVFKENDK
jgi:metal-responsive CopG/Arc/MetJ family transcriptional regulator